MKIKGPNEEDSWLTARHCSIASIESLFFPSTANEYSTIELNQNLKTASKQPK
jgi:hypothetical protein